MTGIIVAVVIILLLLFIIPASMRVIQQYERGVVFVLGRLRGVSGPGLIFIPPFVSRVVKVDLRIVTMQVPPQEVITRDNVTIRVAAVIYFYVVNPEAATINVVHYVDASMQIGQTTLRNVLGQSDLDELLAYREKLNTSLQTIIDQHVERWGVKVTAVAIKDVELPSTMQRAMAKQAEAEREKRAKIIHAEGELQASTQLAQAASIMAAQPSAIQLRYLQTLTEIAVEKNSTIIFPLPMDIIAPIIKGLDHSSESAQERPPMRPLAVSDYQNANSAYDPQAERSEVSLNEQLEAAKQREEEPATVTTRPENR
ncbi:SPFH_eoslipins_u1 domain-containing protein [Ktedonobacteria bacterium brp13]|nr:SPFH_eoslipins_u1 domain-containing protein [Ktedonobacteria bacterium brp13]